VRIISGRARGRKLFSPPGHSQTIRPTSDRARESLFNIISAHVEFADVLDLFAGTGAMGLEALSRGAKSITFVENNRQALELIKRNIRVCMPGMNTSPPSEVPRQATLPELPADCSVSVIQHDLRKGLPLKTFDKMQLSSFDLVFLDPPYSTGLCLRILTEWDRNNRLTTDGLLIAEERSSEKMPEEFSTLKLVDRRIYGDTGFWIFQKHSTCS